MAVATSEASARVGVGLCDTHRDGRGGSEEEEKEEEEGVAGTVCVGAGEKGVCVLGGKGSWLLLLCW